MNFPARCLFLALLLLFAGSSSAQTFNEILGRPTDKSLTISILFNQVVQVYVEYGTTPGIYPQSTTTVTSLPETPVVLELQPLAADTRYYYRTVYKTPNAANFQFGPQRTFHTQRAPGQKFTFTVEADEHLYDKKGIRSLYQICLQNQARDSADFMLSLGDIFGDDHTPLETTSDDMKALHLDYRQYLGAVCHSLPFFVCLGNHEGESGYYLDQTPPNNIAVYGTNWRKFYYPNPVPNDFYSGNMTVEPNGIGLPENYYAWTWGDALFVVLDVYRDCDVNEKPQKWDWTLGETQYKWLKTTLETSNAAHKFVFAHHNRGQGRGGIVPATGFEWGGIDGNLYKFDEFRPGWGLPIHQLMVQNGVDIFFQGHDHLYARESLDGLVYQEVPMPSDSTYQIGMLANANAYTDLTLDGAGHIRVTVEPTCVTVDYVGAYLPADTLGVHKNREIRYSYKVGDCALSTHDGADAQNAAFDVFPNPTSRKLSIKARNTSSYDRKIDLFNKQGALIRSAVLPAGAEQCELELENISPGLHLVRISEGSSTQTKKVLIY
ncbi:MAG: T9SS type A sorting domain-containing protein [Bacteroidota bacterium]